MVAKSRKSMAPAEESQTPSTAIQVAWIIGSCGALGAIVAAFIALIGQSGPDLEPDPDSSHSLSPSQSSLPSPDCPSAGFFGRPMGDVTVFSVNENYDPSGLMGDIGDITVANIEDVVTFTYETKGRGPHEWDWKYVDGELSSGIAQFSGVMLLSSPNNWGTTAGYDLRGMTSVSWEARSLTGAVWVEFVIGGVTWRWDGDSRQQECVPVPDSMPRISLGKYLLTSSSQSFEYDLSGLPEEYLMNVIGGFGWTISWGPNDVVLNDDRTGPIEPRIITIDVSNIQYAQSDVESS